MAAPAGVLVKDCEVCGGRFTAKRERAKFCSPRCQMRSSRARQRGEVLPPPRREGAALVALPAREPDADGILRVTERDLDAAGRTATPSGQAALLMARILDGGLQDTGSSIAALVRQYEASMAKALEGAEQAVSPLEQARRARALKTG